MAVDILGLLLALHVTPADEQERDQIGKLAEEVQAVTKKSVKVCYADQGDTGDCPTQAAKKVLAEYLSEQNIKSAIRITPMAGNCAGPHLRLRVGEVKASDSLFRHGGLLFSVDQKLLAECGSIRIDYVESCTSCCCSGGCGGFRISGERKYPFVGRCVTEPTRCDLRCGIDSPPPPAEYAQINNLLDFAR